MGFFMKKIVATLLSLVFLTSHAMAQMDYRVIDGSHQRAGVNREKANIIVIRCADGKKFFIYSYFRTEGPNYRAIDPPHWGSPIGGMDYTTYEDAVHAACYT